MCRNLQKLYLEVGAAHLTEATGDPLAPLIELAPTLRAFRLQCPRHGGNRNLMVISHLTNLEYVYFDAAIDTGDVEENEDQPIFDLSKHTRLRFARFGGYCGRIIFSLAEERKEGIMLNGRHELPDCALELPIELSNEDLWDESEAADLIWNSDLRV